MASMLTTLRRQSRMSSAKSSLNDTDSCIHNECRGRLLAQTPLNRMRQSSLRRCRRHSLRKRIGHVNLLELARDVPMPVLDQWQVPLVDRQTIDLPMRTLMCPRTSRICLRQAKVEPIVEERQIKVVEKARPGAIGVLILA